MRHPRRGLWVCGLILLLAANPSAAQSASTAQLNGNVKDPSGAALPGTTITVTQTDTGLIRTTATDEAGSYVLQNLPVGPYRLEVGSASRPASTMR